jgi:serine/threonine-protein kinase
MECLDENAVAAFFERRLPSDAVARIDEHVSSCPACHQLLAAFADVFPGGSDGPLPEALAPTTPAEDAALAESGLRGEAAIARHLAAVHAERRVGTVLANRWTLERVLGVGGMGQVFAATHRNGKRAAIKVLRSELSGAPSIVRRFVQEGYAANRVGHPGAVSVLDDGVAEDGAIFLVMDLLEGETLKARMARTGPMPVTEVLRYATDVLSVLAAAHARGIVHRDIKPENLFVTTEGSLRVLDFGIARVRELSGEGGSTESGLSMGTPAFMPPEQARGQTARVDARADIWAVGATMFTLLTGQAVRTGGNAREELFAAMTTPVRSIASALPGISPAVAALVDRALAFEPEDRWPDALAMSEAIAAVGSGSAPREPAGLGRARRGRHVGMALGACALALLAVPFALKGPPRAEALAHTATPPAPGTSGSSPPSAAVAESIPVAAEPSPPASSLDTPAAPRPTARKPPPKAPSPAPSLVASSPLPKTPPPESPPESDPPRDPLERHY